MAESVQVLNVNHWHKQLALYLIANPTARLPEVASHFEVTPSYISILRNSDAFKAYYDSLVDKQLMGPCGDVVSLTAGMTALALERINQKLDTIGDVMPVGDLVQIAETGLKRLGYGANKNSPAPTVAVNVGVVVPRSELADARRLMEEAHGAGSSSIKQLSAPQPASGDQEALAAPVSVTVQASRSEDEKRTHTGTGQ